MAVNDRHHSSNNRLLVVDTNSNIRFLIDSGADVSVIPPTLAQRRLPNNNVFLYTANKSRIKTFGEQTLVLNLGLRRPFRWTFMVADVSRPILGADFLSYFNILVSLRHRKFIDGLTKASRGCTITQIRRVFNNLICIDHSLPFQDLLTEFKDIAQYNLVPKNALHGITHPNITECPPVFANPRRLSPEKLKAAEAEIKFLLEAGICRPSRSPWASPLHMVRKKDGEWRAWRGCATYWILLGTA